MKIVCSSGGLIIQEGTVLLVKVTYGANKGYWMIPGGMVEQGETFEQAAIREVYEETNVAVQPKRLIAVRTGLKETAHGPEYGIYFVYEMELISGSPRSDGHEVSEAGFRPINEVIKDPTVVDLSQQIIRAYRNSSPDSGLTKLETAIHTNHKYTNYDVYTTV